MVPAAHVTSRRIPPALVVALGVLVASSAPATTTLTPADVTFTGTAGDCFAEHKIATVDAEIPQADILITVDLTGSMGEEEAQLQSLINNVVTAVAGEFPDTQWGLATFQDYPNAYDSMPRCAHFDVYGSPPDAPFTLRTPIGGDVLAAVAGMPSASGGGDLPEAQARTLYEAVFNPAIGWRPGSRRFVLQFTDAPPHGCSYSTCTPVLGFEQTGIDPGRDEIMNTFDDLNFEAVIENMYAAGIALLSVDSSGFIFNDFWACEANLTGGFGVGVNTDGSSPAGLDLPAQILDLLREAAGTCPTLELRAADPYGAWVVSTPVYTDVPLPATREFDVSICIPPGTPAGVYDITVELFCHSGATGSQHVRVEVGGGCAGCPGGEPPTLTAGTIAPCYRTVAEAEAAALAATTVDDPCGAATPPTASTVGTCDAVVTVTGVNPCGADSVTYPTRIDDAAPVLSGVPADATVECPEVPPADPVTATDACFGATPVELAEAPIPGRCPGYFTLVRTWSSADGCGNVVSASQRINVVDTTPPAVSGGGGEPITLWPPNHWYVCFGADQLGVIATDACSEPVSVRFLGCSSDQPDNGLGDGDTSNDCVVSPDGSWVCVRSERQGTGPNAQAGRHYTVAFVASDACGNESSGLTATIHVPHDQSPRERATIDVTHHGCRPNTPLPCFR